MKIERIVCPHCGREYMPAEIFMPEDLLGKPMEVIRNEAGHIEFYLGDSPDFVETYVCDECNTEFKVEANLTLTVLCCYPERSEGSFAFGNLHLSGYLSGALYFFARRRRAEKYNNKNASRHDKR